MANGTTTQGTTTKRPLLDQQQINALSWLLGRGASGVMAEHPESWQYQFGLIGADMAKSQQYAQLIKDTLAGGGKVNMAGDKTTIHIPSAMSGPTEEDVRTGKTGYPTIPAPTPAPAQPANTGAVANFLRALFSNSSQTQG